MWKFAEFAFDELKHELSRDGLPITLESKPKDVLALLLTRSEQVVTQADIIERVWAGRRLSEGSVGVAVNKLRDAFGDEARQRIIRTVKGGGYTMAVPVEHIERSPTDSGAPFLVAGQDVPGRPGWQLETELSPGTDPALWTTRRAGGSERRVVHLTRTADGLARLHRAAQALEALRAVGPESWRFGQVLEVHESEPPFLLETEYLGPGLPEWIQLRGGVDQIAEGERIELVAHAAQAIATAHKEGQVHGALSPDHLHIDDAGPQISVRISGFGEAATAPQPTAPGEQSAARMHPQTVYTAPEMAGGATPSPSADVYALGVMLYQLLSFNLMEGPLPGWEGRIADPLLREDIADAANLNPAARLASASVLANRLGTLPLRREQAETLRQSRDRAEAAERELALQRARQPLRVALAWSLALGCLLCLLLLWRAVRERNETRHQAAIAEAMSQFLAVDVLSRDNPAAGKGGPNQTLDQAIQGAAPSIDVRFAKDPLVAARLHETIAQALTSQTEFMQAAAEFGQAADWYRRGEAAPSPSALKAQYQRALVLARSALPNTLPQSRQLIADSDKELATIAHPGPEVRMWRAEADGIQAVMEGDAPRSLREMSEAARLADETPSVSPQTARSFHQRLIATEMKRGDPAAAERDARVLLAQLQPTEGQTGPAALGTRLSLTEAVFLQGRYAEAIALANQLYPDMVAKVGAANDETVTLLATRAAAEGEAEQWAPSVRDDLEVHRLAAASFGEANYMAVGSLLDAALSECREGAYTQGLQHARAGLAEMDRAGEGLKGLHAGALAAVATCLVLPGDLRHHGVAAAQAHEASALLHQIDIPAVEQMVSDPTWGGEVYLLEADLEHMQGDDAQARIDTGKAAAEFHRGKTGTYEGRALQELETALGM